VHGLGLPVVAYLTSRTGGRSKGSLSKVISDGRMAASQLAVALEDIAAAVPHLKAMGHKRSAAFEQIAPAHAAIAVAEPGSGRSARSQVLHVDGPSNRAREHEENEAGHDVLHRNPSFLPPI